MPVAALLIALLVEASLLTGGLLWTFRRAEVPVGVLGAAGLAAVVATSQLLLAFVLEAGFDTMLGLPTLAVFEYGQLGGASVGLATLSGLIGAPLALKRFLRLDARWTRALSRELAAGFIASTMGALVLTAVVGGLAAVVYALVR
jgi:hypothetical protein